jgi:hypothetical protein
MSDSRCPNCGAELPADFSGPESVEGAMDEINERRRAERRE